MTGSIVKLQLIQGGLATSPAIARPHDVSVSSPVASRSGLDLSFHNVRNQLHRVLKAHLTPVLTVEQAAHLGRVYADGEEPEMEELLSDLRILRNAGLDVLMNLEDEPDGIILMDPKKFLARFPELAEAIPVMIEHEGVMPYTDGMPRLSSQARAI